MNNFITLSELKEKKLKEAEMNTARGGNTLRYGIDPPDLENPPW